VIFQVLSLPHVVLPESQTHYFFLSVLHLVSTMDRLGHATRSRGIKQPATTSWSGGKVPSAVRKLVTDPEVESPVRLPVMPVAAVMPSVGEHVEADNKERDEEQEAELYCQFIGETDSLRQLFLESAICSVCRKGSLEISLIASPLAFTQDVRTVKPTVHPLLLLPRFRKKTEECGTVAMLPMCFSFYPKCSLAMVARKQVDWLVCWTYQIYQ
jgi:hypothetical protein